MVPTPDGFSFPKYCAPLEIFVGAIVSAHNIASAFQIISVFHISFDAGLFFSICRNFQIIFEICVDTKSTTW